jgi:hypothetical protein
MMSGTSDAGRKMREGCSVGVGLSFDGPHGMVTLVFFSENQASFEDNPA